MERYKLEMALQFTVDDSIQPIVSLSYLSSNEMMAVDDPSQTSGDEVDRDRDIEILDCYRETQLFVPQTVAEIFMTTTPSGCLDDLSVPEVLYGPWSSEGTYLPSDLIDLVLGQGPSLETVCRLVNNQLPNAANWNQFQIRPSHHLYMNKVNKAQMSVTSTSHSQMTSSAIGPTMPT